MTTTVESELEAMAQDLHPEYARWLVRVSQTYASVSNCCHARLRDPERAQAVSLAVVGGLLERPRVWQFYGLPFSGRVAHLTEKGLAEAGTGDAPRGAAWPDVEERLLELEPGVQEVFVHACLDGLEGADLAQALACDEDEAGRRQERMLGRLREIGALALAPEGTSARHDERE